MRQRHYRDSVVHFTGYAAMMDARWASVVGDEDGYFRAMEVHPSLRGSVDLCSLGSTSHP